MKLTKQQVLDKYFGKRTMIFHNRYCTVIPGWRLNSWGDLERLGSISTCEAVWCKSTWFSFNEDLKFNIKRREAMRKENDVAKLEWPE